MWNIDGGMMGLEAWRDQGSLQLWQGLRPAGFANYLGASRARHFIRGPKPKPYHSDFMNTCWMAEMNALDDWNDKNPSPHQPINYGPIDLWHPMTTAVSQDTKKDKKKCASAIWIYPSSAVPDSPLTLAAGDSRAHLPNMLPPSRGSPPSCHSNSHQPWLPGVASPVTAVAQLSTRTTAASRPWSWFHWHQLLGQLMGMEQWNCFGTNSRKPCHCWRLPAPVLRTTNGHLHPICTKEKKQQISPTKSQLHPKKKNPRILIPTGAEEPLQHPPEKPVDVTPPCPT